MDITENSQTELFLDSHKGPSRQTEAKLRVIDIDR